MILKEIKQRKNHILVPVICMCAIWAVLTIIFKRYPNVIIAFSAVISERKMSELELLGLFREYNLTSVQGILTYPWIIVNMVLAYMGIVGMSDIFYKDERNGTVQLYINQLWSRRKYYLNKVISGVVVFLLTWAPMFVVYNICMHISAAAESTPLPIVWFGLTSVAMIVLLMSIATVITVLMPRTFYIDTSALLVLIVTWLVGCLHKVPSYIVAIRAEQQLLATGIAEWSQRLERFTMISPCYWMNPYRIADEVFPAQMVIGCFIAAGVLFVVGYFLYERREISSK